VVDNASDGFDLYHLDTGSFIRNFPTGMPTKRYPKQVEFSEDSRVVIGGSDHGCVYVFDRKTGSVLDILRHADQGLVQTITVRN
jgi:outer membrane protein assembly factor BamB